MNRLLLLTISALLIFIGFCIPFMIEGIYGVIMAIVMIIFGSASLWVFEVKTRKSLEKETTFNKILKADGDNFIERE